MSNKENEDTISGVPKSYLSRFVSKYSVGDIMRIDYVFKNYEKLFGEVGVIAGWARTVRLQANNTLVFVELSDGSYMKNLQVVVEQTMPNFEEIKKAGVAFSFKIKGEFAKTPGKPKLLK